MDGVGEGSPEHDLELREPEDEPVLLIDQDDVNIVAELVGQPGRQLQTAEARTENDDAHGRRLTAP